MSTQMVITFAYVCKYFFGSASGVWYWWRGWTTLMSSRFEVGVGCACLWVFMHVLQTSSNIACTVSSWNFHIIPCSTRGIVANNGILFGESVWPPDPNHSHFLIHWRKKAFELTWCWLQHKGHKGSLEIFIWNLKDWTASTQCLFLSLSLFLSFLNICTFCSSSFPDVL